MDFFETVARRHSARDYTGEPVPQEDITTILETATRAPSATNSQPWRFIVITDADLKESMRDITGAVLEAGISESQDEDRRRRLKKMMAFSLYFASAPVVVAVLARPWAAKDNIRGPDQPDSTARDLAIESVSMAVAHLLLAATALGYGSCFASAPAEFAREELESLLGVKSPWFLMGLVSIGKTPASRQRRATRRPVGEVSTFIGHT